MPCPRADDGRMIPHDEAVDVPLDTPEAVERRIRDTVGRAIRRQTWLLLLDEQLRQLPVMLPIEDLPERPEAATAEGLAGMFTMVADEFAVHGVVVVLERPGEGVIHADERAWLRSFDTALRDAGLKNSGFVLSHTRGVRWLPMDEWM